MLSYVNKGDFWLASVNITHILTVSKPGYVVETLAAPSKLAQLCTINNNDTKQASSPVTTLTKLERLYNSRICTPETTIALAAIVRLANRLSNSCTQLS